MKWIKKMLRKYREIILYLIFGVLTTAVNWCIDVPLEEFTSLPAALIAAIAWFAAVVFAFFTNKIFVFESRSWTPSIVIPEILQFLSCRIGSGLLDIGFMFVTDDIFGWNHYLMKTISSIFVIVINYIGSKLLFKKNKDS